jgi:hypothetical protein
VLTRLAIAIYVLGGSRCRAKPVISRTREFSISYIHPILLCCLVIPSQNLIEMPDVRGLGLWKLLLVVAFVCCCQAAHHGAHHHEFLHLLSRQTSSSGFAVVPPGTVANSSIANITTQCVNAMEATVQCDDSLNTIAAADYFLPANATDFQSVCVKACGSSLATYHQTVVSACAGQPQAWDGFPATYFGDLLWATWNLTCLSDSKTGQSCMCKSTPNSLEIFS